MSDPDTALFSSPPVPDCSSLSLELPEVTLSDHHGGRPRVLLYKALCFAWGWQKETPLWASQSVFLDDSSSAVLGADQIWAQPCECHSAHGAGWVGLKAEARQGIWPPNSISSLSFISPSHSPQTPRPLGIGSAPCPGPCPPQNTLTGTLSRLCHGGGLLHWQISTALWLGRSCTAAIIVKSWRVMRIWAVIFLINTHSNVQKKPQRWMKILWSSGKKMLARSIVPFHMAHLKKKKKPFFKMAPSQHFRNISFVFLLSDLCPSGL